MDLDNKDTFSSPGPLYRGTPFWSWNDALDSTELATQVHGMAAVGLGGAFMHSRVGLITPYLSEEWMDRVRRTVKEAKRARVKAWLYDEDRWPSGFAGGLVAALGKRHRQKRLTLTRFNITTKPGIDGVLGVLRHFASTHSDPGGNERALIAAFACDMEGERMRSCKLLHPGKVTVENLLKEKANTVLVFRMLHAQRLPWLNGSSYVDTLAPRVTRAFIRSTYEAYRREVGGEFRKTVPGIFTDEPRYLYDSSAEECIPWTEKLPDYFSRKNGYGIVARLPLLFFEAGGCEKARYDFWSTVTDLFLESFSQRLFAWCSRNGLALTGHYMGEDTLASQVRFIGAAMPHYEYMHIPGIDHLGRNIDVLMTVKQVSSVAHQLGRRRVLSELYGCSGWNLSFEQQKWIGDWEYALGVNLRCQHLMLYTLRGCRKRDCPPSISYQQPWWRYYRMVEDYFGRLSYALSQGEFDADILVIHPIGSGWAVYRPGDTGGIDKLNRQFLSLSTWLCELHRDYDYGDEKVLKKHGRVTKDGRLAVGRSSYRVAIVPPGVTLAASTLSLLKRFVERRGTVIALRPTPALVGGAKSRAMEAFFSGSRVTVVACRKAPLRRALDTELEPAIRIVGPGGEERSRIYYQQRRLADGRLYFMVNTDPERGHRAGIALRLPEAAKGIRSGARIECWDAASGQVSSLHSHTARGATRFKLYFPPAGSHLVAVKEGGTEQATHPKTDPARLWPFESDARRYEVLSIVQPRQWSVRRLSPNSLPLDYCRYRIEDGSWSGRVPVWKAQKVIRARYGLEDISTNTGVQFWKSYRQARDPGPRAVVWLAFEFDSELGPHGGEVSLVVETPERFQMRVNGRLLKHRDTGWWVDKSFRRIRIDEHVRKGKNEILLECQCREDIELENVYIVGDFAVRQAARGKFVLGGEDGRAVSPNWVKRGYPFFAGTMCYETTLALSGREFDGRRRLFLVLERLDAIVARIAANAKEAGTVAWRPYQVEVTRVLRPGRNTLRIDLTNSLRNLLGPHHHAEGEPLYVGPYSFLDGDESSGRSGYWTDTYNFVPNGLLGKVRLVASSQGLE